MGFSADRLQLNCLDYSTTNRSGNCTHDATTKFGLTYSYGTAGSNNSLISSITDSVDSGRNATYTYDSLYRLTGAVTAGSTGYPAWGLSETYDRYGNRSAQSIYSGCTGITCPTNSVTPDTATNRIIGDCYDANGNLMAESAPPCPSPTYVYDAENHAVSYSSASYTYDGNGLRVKKVAGTTTTVYLFSGSKVIAEYDNGAAVGSPSREYIYAGAALLAKIDSSGTKYYHQDQLSNRLVTDSSGSTVAQMGTFPYGESWYNASGDKLLFTTYERDSESGNDYAQARYNLSRLSRFSSPDPIAGSTSDPQSLNRYSYVRNMPFIFTDPQGTCPPTVQNRDSDGSQSTDGTGGPSAEINEAASPEPQAQPCAGTMWNYWSYFGGGMNLDGGFNGDDSGYGVGFAVGSSGGGIGGGNDPWGVARIPVVGTFYPEDGSEPGWGLFMLFPGGPGGDNTSDGDQSKLMDPWKLLGPCVKQIFKVTEQSFTPSTPGTFGSFTGTLANNKEFTVTNDAKTYSTNTLTWRYAPLTALLGGSIYGYTNGLSPYKNYTANDLSPSELTTAIQIHELGHSLAAISFGNPFARESWGDKLLDCVTGMTK
jgi:RHS repeat-associated protein